MSISVKPVLLSALISAGGKYTFRLSIKNNLVGRIPQNFFTVTAVERQREVCRHFGAHNTDSANTCFARGKEHFHAP